MLTVQKTGADRGVRVHRIDSPSEAPARHMVRLQIHAAGICGSDVHAYEWTSGYEFMLQNLPVTLGHEFCGLVHAIGADVKGLVPGDRVVCWPTIPCGSCEGCLRERPNECRARSIIGLHRDGGFAEWLDVAAEQLFVIPNTLPSDIAALTEPLGVCVNAVDLSEAKAGDAVVVLGPGPIGIGAAWVAQNRGAQVLLAGLNDAERLSRATAMGLPHVVDLATDDLTTIARDVFGRDPDIVIEATGHPASVPQGLALLRPGGILVVVGIHANSCEIDLTRLVREKKQIRGAHDTTRHAFKEAIRLLSENQAALSQLISHRLPLSSGAKAFEIATGKSAVKVMLIPDEIIAEGLI